MFGCEYPPWLPAVVSYHASIVMVVGFRRVFQKPEVSARALSHSADHRSVADTPDSVREAIVYPALFLQYPRRHKVHFDRRAPSHVSKRDLSCSRIALNVYLDVAVSFDGDFVLSCLDAGSSLCRKQVRKPPFVVEYVDRCA